MDTLFDTGKPEQNLMEFPESLTERYQPKCIDDFIGLARPKALIKNFLANPIPAPLLFIGPPGAGKSVMGLAMAKALGTLVHIPAQRCDVAMLTSLEERFAYYPPIPKWWTCLVDEADQMTERAQLMLLSKMDFAATLVPTFGGGSVKGAPSNVIWVFTCNGRGPKGTEPPPNLAPRFLSRCMVVEFEATTQSDLAAYLQRVWLAEGGGATPEGYFDHIADGDGVRDAMNRLQTDLLAGPREVPARVTPGPVLVAAARTGDREVTMTDIEAEARKFIEGDVVVWQNEKNLWRVGVRTRTPGRYVEDGKKIIGAGATPMAALRDARKRA